MHANDTDAAYLDAVATASTTCGCEPSNSTSWGEISNRVSTMGDEQYYANNMRCQWTLSSAPNTQLTFEITTFDTEYEYDVLHIYSCSDAACAMRTELGRLSGNLDELERRGFTSLTGFLQLVFVSDENGVRKGFNGKWAASHTAPASLQEEDGTGSPGFVWSAQHIGILSALVSCQLFLWCNILRIANMRVEDGIQDRQDAYLAIRSAI